MLPPGMGILAVSRASTGGQPDRQHAEILPRLGAGDRADPPRLLPVHAGDAAPVRSPRGTENARRGGPDRGLRAACAACPSRSVRGRGVGAGDTVPRPRRVLEHAHRGSRCLRTWTPTTCYALPFERFRLSLGVGLGRLKGRVFRIGHLGSLNDLEVLATVGGVELALHEAGVPIRLGSGVTACEEVFAASAAATIRCRPSSIDGHCRHQSTAGPGCHGRRAVAHRVAPVGGSAARVCVV